MDEEKLAYVYRKYRLVVLDTAFHILNDYHLAQDVCQEVFIKLAPERLELEDGTTQMASYLRIVARNRAIDYLRTINSRKEVSYEESNVYAVEADEMRLDNKIICEMTILELLERLWKYNKDWYHIFVRVKVYEEPQEYVARSIGMRITSLRTKLHRAIKWLKNNYREDYKKLDEL